MMKKVILGFLALFLFTISPFAADKKITKKDVQTIVNKAVKLIEKEGPKALEKINKKDGEFKQGSLYVFVYDKDVTIVAHAFKQKLVGKNYKGKPDIKGKKFRDDIVNNTLKNGTAWTDYVYQKPGEKGLFNKTVFSKVANYKGTKYIVCAGMYKEK